MLKMAVQDESRYPPVASTARPATLPTTTEAQAIHDLAASLKHEALQACPYLIFVATVFVQLEN